MTASPKAFLDRLAAVDGSTAVGLEAGVASETGVPGRHPQPRHAKLRGTGRVKRGRANAPARMVATVRRACPRGTVLAVDSGAHRAWCSQYWPSYGDRDYLSLANLAPMGGAIPLGMGAKLARPERPLVVATGDGCMLMHGLEIHTAARHQLPLVILVFDNHSYGNIWYRAAGMGPGPEGLTEIEGIDWGAFARSLGGDGVTVQRPEQLGEALERGLAYPGPFVVAARIDKRYPTPVAPWRRPSPNGRITTDGELPDPRPGADAAPLAEMDRMRQVRTTPTVAPRSAGVRRDVQQSRRCPPGGRARRAPAVQRNAPRRVREPAILRYARPPRSRIRVGAPRAPRTARRAVDRGDDRGPCRRRCPDGLDSVERAAVEAVDQVVAGRGDPGDRRSESSRGRSATAASSSWSRCAGCMH